MFLILFSTFFALSGGLQALFLNPNVGASRPLNRGLTFVYFGNVNNQGPRVLADLLGAVVGAALVTFVFLGVFWAARWGIAEAGPRR